MFHNYFFLKRLAQSLNRSLKTHTLSQCYSQNKDELIIQFEGENGVQTVIKADLNPNVALLQITDDCPRARRNSVDLFGAIINKKVEKVYSFPYERSFAIAFEHDYTFVFKMHGRRANILLFEGPNAIKTFRKNLTQDHSLKLTDFAKEIALTKSNFLKYGAEPLDMIPALGKESKIFLARRKFGEANDDEKWEILLLLLKELAQNPIYLIDAKIPSISLLVPNENKTEDAVAATNWLYAMTVKTLFFDKKKEQIANLLRHRIKKAERYLIKTREKRHNFENDHRPEDIANIIMANLQAIPSGTSNVVLTDVYTNLPVTIKLNPALSPQKNAEKYYRKAKNRHQEVNAINKNIDEKKNLIAKLRRDLLMLDEVTDSKQLRKYMNKNSPTKNENDNKKAPYHQFEMDEWKILVGKNSKANDELTLKVAKKNDLWLHAKDATGAHVIIKEKAGHNYPKTVIAYAAQLAAANSKRKKESLCQVIYTPKKFVRKIKGSAPGQVIVDKETILMVSPNID